MCMFVVAGIQMKYDFPAEMPSNVNHIFFLINTLSLTGYTLVIVLVYIKQHTRTEKARADQLKELDEVKTRLYTNITHEFRTPLTVILGMADQIEAHPEKWLTRGVEKIRSNSGSLLKMVNQMLDLSRLEAGAMPLKMIHGDVIRFVRMLTESFDSMGESRDVELFFHADFDSFQMDYDPDQLERIVSNLLSNALKYTPPGGTVTISISNRLINKKAFLEMTVRDTGIGMSADKLEHIYERFYRIEDGSSQNNWRIRSGTGHYQGTRETPWREYHREK